MSRQTFGIGTAARYWRHPAGGSDTLWGDGCPMDSGTAAMVVNNIHHLRDVSHRQLICQPIVGALSVINNGGWDSGLAETVRPAALRTGTYDVLSWSRRVAWTWGPFPVLTDNDPGDTPGFDQEPRAIRVRVRCNSDGGNSLLIYFATTPTRMAPDGGDAEGLVSLNTTSATSVALSGILHPRGRVLTTHVVGDAADTGSGVVQVPEFYIHMGYVMTAGSAIIDSVAAWEIDT